MAEQQEEEQEVQLKPRGLTTLEYLPLAATHITAAASLRAGLTRSAIARGRKLASDIKPDLKKQATMAIGIEDLQGQMACNQVRTAARQQTTLMEKVYQHLQDAVKSTFSTQE